MKVTEDTADLRLLELANERGKFAIQMGAPTAPSAVAAFERGIDQDWFTMVDVAPLESAGGMVCRVFKLTQCGQARLAALKARSGQ